MRSSFARSPLTSPHCRLRGGGARRHPHPRLDLPRARRRSPASLSSTVDSSQVTHTNRSPIIPVHFSSPVSHRNQGHHGTGALPTWNMDIIRACPLTHGLPLVLSHWEHAVTASVIRVVGVLRGCLLLARAPCPPWPCMSRSRGVRVLRGSLRGRVFRGLRGPRPAAAVRVLRGNACAALWSPCLPWFITWRCIPWAPWLRC
jgi:hypothetical protein